MKAGTRAGAAYGAPPDQEKDGAEDMSVLAWLASMSPSPSFNPDFFRDPGRRPIRLLSVIPRAPPQLSSPANHPSRPHRRKYK